MAAAAAASTAPQVAEEKKTVVGDAGIRTTSTSGSGTSGGTGGTGTALPPTLVNRLVSLIPIEFSSVLNRVLITNVLPDRVVRHGMRWMLWDRVKEYSTKSVEYSMEYKQAFIRQLRSMPLAIVTDKANEQHYEVPSQFYLYVLGRHLKYSCCLYEKSTSTLEEAERAMLELYCVRAEIVDGMSILDLGCGWGSFCLFAAAKFPKSRVTAVSNSRTQREYIEGQAKERGLTNLRVITCDVNHLTGDILGIRRSGEGGAAALVADAKVAAHTKPDAKKKPATDEPDSATGGGVSGGGGTETLVGGFDRVITIEMFEHMKNYDRLFGRVAEWVKPDTGRVFIHVFTNKTTPYHFEGDNWMARYFFAGGTMPSDDLFVYFQRDLQLLNQWCVNGKHYARTSRHWLNRMDANQPAIRKLFAETYGGPAEGKRWWVMWRVFFMAVEEMFAYNDGKEWLVSHYLFSRPSRPTATASATA